MIPKKGDEVILLVEGQKLRGKVQGDAGGMLIISDEKLTVYVNKAKIGAIIMDSTIAAQSKEEVQLNSDQFVVMACACEKIGCNGVRYIKMGSGAAQNDFDGFMAKCKKRNPTCKRASLGKLSSVPMGELKDMLDNTIFGEYPD